MLIPNTKALLKPPNIRGNGYSMVEKIVTNDYVEHGIQHVIRKFQVNYTSRPIWNFFRATPKVRRELRALEALRRCGLNVPLVLAYRANGTKAELITSFIEHAVPYAELLPVVEDSKRRLIIEAIADLIGELHNCRWTHGSLGPPHILISGWQRRPKAHLIDLEKAKQFASASRDLKRFKKYSTVFTASDHRVFDQRYRLVRQKRDRQCP